MLCSLGFWGDATFPTINNINARGRLALGTLVCARELGVHMVCTYAFSLDHESSSFRLICYA